MGSLSGISTMGRSGKAFLMRSSNTCHSTVPWKSSAMKEPPVVYLIFIVQIHALLDRARVNASQAPHGLGERPVGRRIILRPERESSSPVSVEPSTIAVIPSRRIHHARKSEFSFFLIIMRERRDAIFDGGIFAERPLISV